MSVSFSDVSVGQEYSRQELARIWGYSEFHALARGVVTPRGDNKVILFVTKEKQASSTPYEDCLSGTALEWEGPSDHFAEDRILTARTSGDEIHLFYRERHHRDFIYYGQLELVSCERFTDRPSRFAFRTMAVSGGTS